jgi:hypothetical protein
MLQWESSHERNAFRLLDCDSAIQRFSEQPCKIYFHLEGELRQHYPDILVQLGDHKELWEIKTAEDAHDPDVVKRTNLLMSSLPSWGYIYRVVLAHDLAAQPRLDNAMTLLQFGRGSITLVERELIRQLFQQADALRWGDVCEGAFGNRGRAIVSRLVLEGALSLDMHNPISSFTLLKAQKGIL